MDDVTLSKAGHGKTILSRWGARIKQVSAGKRLFIGGLILLFFSFVAAFADFIAPYDYRIQSRLEPSAPPAQIRFRDAQGGWHLRPFIYAAKMTDPLARSYSEDQSRIYPLAFFVRGNSYKLFGLLESNLHLFGLQDTGQGNAPRLYLLGTDALGRDRLSRLLQASRFSLAVAPLSTVLAGVLGILLGCVAGYGGRLLDALLMRVADAVMALPALIVVLAARAAFPLELPPMRAGILLVSIFVAIGWAEIARLARGETLALRQREFVLAAHSLGLAPLRILLRHILPNMSGPLLVQMTLMLPAFLLNETALSFLGVGLQEPEPSWGNMLAAANDLTLLQAQPFILLTPAVAIFLFVLAVRLLSDGLRQTDDK
jgi:peptide/nickel transport system permease protein